MQVFSKLARCETRNGFGHDRYSKMVLVAVSSHIYMSFSKSWSSIRSLDAIRFDNVAGRTLDCDRVPTHGDLLCALSAATESSSSQHAVLTWCTDNKFEERDSIVEERESMTSTDPPLTPSPACSEVKHCVQLGITRLMKTVRNEGDQSRPSEQRTEIQLTFDLLQSACEVLAHLGSYGSSARTMLRTAGVVDTCFNAIAAIRNYAARRSDENLGTNALASAVASLRRVSIVAGHAEPNSLRGVPIVYDVLRSQLSRPSIQQQGLQLMHVLGRTDEGAKELDKIPGSWQWLGRAQFHTSNKELVQWTCAHTRLEQKQGWSATRLANFLGLRGLKQDSCDELQRNVNDLLTMALLPFEGESPRAWQVRVEAFENRNRVKFLKDIMSGQENK